MKKIFVILFTVISIAGFSQVRQKYPAYGGEWKKLYVIDSGAFRLPIKIASTKNFNVADPDSGQIYYDPTDSTLKYHTGYQWLISGAGGGGEWGTITGTLSDQTDLQAALDAKVPTSRTLTINGVAQDLSANRTWAVGDVLTTRQINTGYGLTGGGDLSANRTLIVDSATLSGYYLRRVDSTGTGYATQSDISGFITTRDRFGKSGEDEADASSRSFNSSETGDFSFLVRQFDVFANNANGYAQRFGLNHGATTAKIILTNNNNTQSEAGFTSIFSSVTDTLAEFTAFASEAIPTFSKGSANYGSYIRLTNRTVLISPNSVAGKLKIANLYSTVDTTNFKPVVRHITDSTVFQMTYWPGGGGATPTLQQVLDAGSTLTGTETIQLTANDFAIDNTSTSNFLRMRNNSSENRSSISVINGSVVMQAEDKPDFITLVNTSVNAGNATGDNAYARTYIVNSATSDANYFSIYEDSTTLRPAQYGAGTYNLFVWRLLEDAGTKTMRYNPSTGRVSYHDIPTGGSATLAGLTDVVISAPADEDLLRFSTGDSKWHNVAASVINTNFANSDLTFTANRTHNASSFWLKVQSLQELELTSGGTPNSFGLKDLKGELGLQIFGNFSATVGADVFAAGGSTGLPVAGMDAFDGGGSNYLYVRPASLEIFTISNDDAETKLLTWNSTDKKVEYRLVSSLPGGGSPGGSDKQVQYNNASAFGGAAGFEANLTDLKVKITQQATTEAGLEIKAIASSAEDLFRISSSAGTGNFLVVDENGKATFGGAAWFTGAVTETASLDRVAIGVAAGTPRMVFEDNGQTVWEIDNDMGTFRWFTPGVIRMTLDGSNGNMNVATGKFSVGGSSSTAQANIVSSAANVVPIRTKLHASQSANAFEINTSAGSNGDVFNISVAGKATAATGSATYKLSGNLTQNTTDVGNVGTGEDDLMTYSIPANTLGTDGDYIEFTMTFKFATNANNKQVRVKYGGTTAYASGAQAQNDGAMVITGKIIRTGATTQDITFTQVNNGTLFVDYADYVTATETLSGAVILKATGEGTSNDDLIQKILTVKFFPAN